MDNPSLIIILAVVTIGIVLALLIWQRARVSQAKDTNEHSAVTTGRANPKP